MKTFLTPRPRFNICDRHVGDSEVGGQNNLEDVGNSDAGDICEFINCHIDMHNVYIQMITTPVSATFLISCSEQLPFTFTQSHGSPQKMVEHRNAWYLQFPSIYPANDFSDLRIEFASISYSHQFTHGICFQSSTF